MKLLITYVILFLTTLSVFGQKAAYVIYNAKGKVVKYEKMLGGLSKNDILLFGELHNNPIAHWLELELVRDLSKQRALILGAEFFESDGQAALNDYLSNTIDEGTLETQVSLWSNYETDYKPIIEYAKSKKIPFIATNVPRQYASLVHKEGFKVLEHLVPDEKRFIAPLPIKFDPDLPTYKKILTMFEDHGTPELVKAQAIKDATMAHFILENYSQNKLFFHINGAYHSDSYEGILWFLKQRNSNLNYVTVSTVEQKNVSELLEENKNKADYIICIPDTMTKTY
ncbi:ChaN family lipoprotein [Aquimarina agarilytica]|uniref:ChaN family lipoprotein n=1 Tax=Aquimarina agarilytica TaxID=1087449 RepID=UPI00028A2481|nr:ChaN family lipoprotein [Aquimarina agarilytica]